MWSVGTGADATVRLVHLLDLPWLPALEQGAELIDAVNEDIPLTEAESPGTINATMDVLQGLGRPITVASTPSGWVARAIMRFWMLK